MMYLRQSRAKSHKIDDIEPNLPKCGYNIKHYFEILGDVILILKVALKAPKNDILKTISSQIILKTLK